MQRMGGMRRKTRNKLKKRPEEKGKISVREYFKKLEQGQAVLLKAEPAVQTGMFKPRFYGKAGIVAGQQGECYKVKIKDGSREKLLIVHPIHLRKI